jgi:hypothetical protein
MSKKGGGKSQGQLDARSRSMNPKDSAGQAALANQAAQKTPGTAAYQAVQDNRSVQLDPTAPKPSQGRSLRDGEGEDALPMDEEPGPEV